MHVYVHMSMCTYTRITCVCVSKVEQWVGGLEEEEE